MLWGKRRKCLIVLLGVVLVLIVIGIHYEALGLATRWLPHLAALRRARVALVVAVALVAHLVEAGLFGVAFHWMVQQGHGELLGATSGLQDALYFSLVCYSSLGFGDIIATGAIRILSSIEAVTGLVMIGWTASFTYVQMEDYWQS